MSNITLKCKTCGNKIAIDSFETNVICDHCGNPFEIPQNESRDRLLNLYSRADNAWEQKDYDTALDLYKEITRIDDHQAQAHFAAALCRYGITYEVDPGNGRKVPTCNRFNRTSIFEDTDYQTALKYAPSETKIKYKETAEYINRITKNFLKIVDNEAPYDVFISYKRTDSDGNFTLEQSHARKLYYYLAERKYKVFFADITLNKIAGENYEPYVFAAISSAPVMVLMGSSKENLESTWVRNEWKRFLNLKSQGEEKTLIPCYLNMDPYDLPGGLNPTQSLDVNSYTFMEDITAIINTKVQSSKKKVPQSSGNALIDKYAPPKKIQSLVGTLDCSSEHAADVLVIHQGNVEDSIEYIRKEKDYQKELWVCAECGIHNTHDVCRNPSCKLSKVASMELKRKREESKLNNEREKKKRQQLINMAKHAGLSIDESLPVEDKIKITTKVLNRKRNPIWPILLIVSFVASVFTYLFISGYVKLLSYDYMGFESYSTMELFDGKISLDKDTMLMCFFISGFAGMFMTAIYFLLARPDKESFWTTLICVGLADVAAYFIILIIVNNPLEMILTFLSNILTLIIGESEPLITDGTQFISFSIVVGLNYIVTCVNVIRVIRLRKSLKTKLRLYKSGYDNI